MLIDAPQVVEGSVIINATVPSGAAFPLTPNIGELFYLTSGIPGLYLYTGIDWSSVAGSSILSDIGTPGTYKSVTTDEKGRVIFGTNPTTIAGYGITDAFDGAFSSLTDKPTTLAGYGITDGGGGGTNFSYQAEAPGSPTVGDRWLDSDTGVLYTWVNDGSASQWIEL
jgi:hypothetical protein